MNKEQYYILRESVEKFNEYRKENLNTKIDLRCADLNDANLIDADLRDADLNHTIMPNGINYNDLIESSFIKY